MSERDVTTLRVWSTKQLISIVSFVVVITFSGTMIWSRFVYMETQNATIRKEIEEKYENVTARIDKKTARIEEDNKNQWQVINELQKNNKKQ
jgi:ABC-type nickel/cobalt efflux system permease component RcnA